MRYYKMIVNNIIIAIGTGCGGTEITKEEYDNYLALFANKPEAPEGFIMKLTATGEWVQEEYTVPETNEEAMLLDDMP